MRTLVNTGPNGGPLSFMCGGANELGSSLKSQEFVNNANVMSQNFLSICQEYPRDRDLLAKQKPIRQKNHYIYHKDTI